MGAIREAVRRMIAIRMERTYWLETTCFRKRFGHGRRFDEDYYIARYRLVVTGLL